MGDSPDTHGLSVAALLRQSKLPSAEARALLAAVLQVAPVWLIAHDDHVPAPAQQAAFARFAELRREGMPMAYLLEEKEFHSRAFKVSPDVLIPRPETEHLVDWALARLAELSNGKARLLEMGCGSGAVAVTLACECPRAHVVATDVSEDALAVAKINAEHWKADIEWHQGDWFAALPHDAAPFDVIVVNPPYLSANDPHLEQGDLRFEPRLALSDEADGLQAARLIVSQAARWLQPGAWLGLEHGYDQGAALRALLTQAGFEEVTTHADWAGHARYSVGRRYA